MLRLTTLCLLAATAAAQAPIVTTVLNNGTTQSRYDIVILGDGYQAQEQARFNSDVNAFLTGLFAKAPYSGFSSYFNAHTVFRASVDSGATHPDVTPPILRNTAYGASYNTGGTDRCLYIQNTSLALADAALAPANETRVLVMVNDSRYGGCASTFAVSYNGASMVEVQSHEMNHAVAGLADEYDYPNGNYTGPEPTQVNVTADGVGQKWSHWWGTESISAFEGARYYATGIWRPRNNCLMRNLGVSICAVCREQIVKTVNGIVDPIDAPQPTGTTTLVRPATQTFSFTNLVPPANNPLITWKLDGAVIPGQTGTSLVLDSTTTALGSRTLTVEVLDRTTQVRNDPSNLLRESHTWTVQVTDPAASNLRLTLQSTPTLFVPAGGEIDVQVTVTNDGPAAAGAFVVEHFLSTDAVLTTGVDVYLGATSVPALGIGQQSVLTRRLRVPAWTTVRPYVLMGVVDRPGAITEVLETDNFSYSTLVVQTPGCTPVLDYRDDLLHPRDQAAVSLATGGQALPTVVAPCAAPGTWYLLVWGCTGTAPGTPFQGLTVPINADSCTLAGLENVNSAVFQAFLAPLDAAGIGRATVAWPAGLPFQAMPTHFAAVLLDPSGSFPAATNAIGFELQ
ncbi:MAG: M64 family metallopeptidase [Planctomycetota bacterium]